MKEHQLKILLVLCFVCFFLLLVSIGTKGAYISDYKDSGFYGKTNVTESYPNGTVVNIILDQNNDSIHGYAGVLTMDCLLAFIFIPLSVFLAIKFQKIAFATVFLVVVGIIMVFRIILEIVALGGSKDKRVTFDYILKNSARANESEVLIHYRDASNYAYFSLIFLNILIAAQTMLTFKQVKDEAEGESVA